ncbi:MAG: class I SAM-dependent methyltransferase [Chlorobiaceae bacterium]|nr:class I SAM-dependent methyltransferase [Chlorobiaceae bacterium]
MARSVCLVCGNIATPYDCCDFMKNCQEVRGKFVPLSLKPVYYYRCAECGFVFSPELCSWTKQQFGNLIYNGDYVNFDPDFVEARPKLHADIITAVFQGYREHLKILDYGGGQGQMVSLLRNAGFNAVSYDPYYDEGSVPEHSDFDLVTAFEVFEHAAAPRRMMEEVAGFLGKESVFLFSTVVSDGQILENGRLTWWYASPRNGHISLYTTKSLRMLGACYGFEFHSFSQGMHAFFRELPDWARPAFYPVNPS